MDRRDYRQRLYDSYVDSHYGPQGLVEPATYQRSVPYFTRNYGALMPHDRSAPILEIGCGAGQFLHYLRHQGYSNLVGIDPSEPMLQRCRDATGLEDLRPLDAAAFFAEQPDRRFACIVANDVAEHLTKDELLEFLDRCLAHLVSGGRLILKVPNAASPFGARERYVDFTHELGFTPESARQVLRAVGFTGVEIRPVRGSYLGGAKARMRGVLTGIFVMPALRAAYALLYGLGSAPAVLTPGMIATGVRAPGPRRQADTT